MDTVKALPQSKNRMLNASFLLLCLSCIDAIFTDLGLRQGLIQEANPITRYIYDTDVFLFYLLKFCLPLLLLYLVTVVAPRFYLRFLVALSLLLYVLVICTHIFWIVLTSLRFTS